MALKRNENKVKFGLKRVAFAIATIAEDGSATYGEPITFPGARTLSMEPQGAGEPWHADDGVYYFSSAPASRQGDLEMARIIDAFKRQVLGYIADANGILLEDMNPAEVHFALMFETMNDKRPRRYVLYNCMATAPTVGSATNEGSKEPQTETSTITSTGIYVPSQGKWFDHGETTPNTDMETYANWFNTVQVPGDPEGPYPIRHKKGNPVVITDAAGDMNIEELTATIKAGQDGSGTPTPANVRRITGLSSTKLARCNANLADISKIVGISNVTVTFPEEGTCRVVTGGQNTYRAANIRPIDMTYPPGKYYVKFKVKANPTINNFTLIGLRTVVGNNLNSNLVHIVASTTDKSYEAVFNTSEDTYFSYVANGNTTGEGYATDVTIYDLIVSKLDVPYEPYAGETYNISWENESGTVYGGTVDMASGRLTVTHALVTIDGTNTIYTEKGSSTTRDVFYIGLPDASIFDGVARYLSVAECAAAGMLCSIAPFAESTDRSLPYLATAYIGREGAMLQLRLSVALSEGLSTVEAVNQFASTLYAAGTPIQYTYPLKEPVTYNLTPTQIRTLQGTNTISADVGTLKVAYHQDPALVE